MLITVLMLSSFFQKAQAVGLNLNPALLGCVISGGDCIKEIPFIGTFLNGGNDRPPQATEHYYRSGIYWSHTGKAACRRAKIEFYLSKYPLETPPALDRDFLIRQHLDSYDRNYCKREKKTGGSCFNCSKNESEIFILYKIKGLRR